MRVSVHWVSGPWPGRIGIVARPRGGDWLEQDVRALSDMGINELVSLLTSEEMRELQLEEEENLCQEAGLRFHSLPILDRGVPESFGSMSRLASALLQSLAEGKRIAVHCRQGIGRSAMTIAVVLVLSGEDASGAFMRIAEARERPVPDTEEQSAWVGQFARRRVLEREAGQATTVAETPSEYESATEVIRLDDQGSTNRKSDG
jgi:protein-tyrosine phosphatase